jgi:hypothetical protein
LERLQDARTKLLGAVGQRYQRRRDDGFGNVEIDPWQWHVGAEMFSFNPPATITGLVDDLVRAADAAAETLLRQENPFGLQERVGDIQLDDGFDITITRRSDPDGIGVTRD